MGKLIGKQIYLSVLEREHCRILFDDFEYDFDMKTETLNIGYSIEKSDDWYLYGRRKCFIAPSI